MHSFSICHSHYSLIFYFSRHCHNTFTVRILSLISCALSSLSCSDQKLQTDAWNHSLATCHLQPDTGTRMVEPWYCRLCFVTKYLLPDIILKLKLLYRYLQVIIYLILYHLIFLTNWLILDASYSILYTWYLTPNIWHKILDTWFLTPSILQCILNTQDLMLILDNKLFIPNT